MTKLLDIRRPRRTFSPDEARQIRRENAAMLVGTMLFWAAVGAGLARMLRWW